MALSAPTASSESPSEPAPAIVLGPPGLTRDIVATVLVATDGAAVAPPDRAVPSNDGAEDAVGSTDVAEDAVTVLVEPTMADWAAARARGAPMVLVVSHEPGDAEVVEAVLAGADAIVCASSGLERLAQAMEVVLAGGTLLQPSQARALASAARTSRHQAPVRLTPRESEIIASIARGEAVKQTALALGIAAKTVENLQSRLFRKLDARNRAHAVVRAHALGLLSAGATPTSP